MVKEQDSTQEIDRKVAQLFSGYLLTNNPVTEYLENRGITQEMIKSDRVGFCPIFAHYWFPLMKGRITVPIHDVHGNIIAFAGRQYDPTAELTKEALTKAYSSDPKQAEKKIQMWEHGKWLNEPYPKIRHLYNLNYAKEHARKYNYIIIVEGYFDALVLAANGFPNTVALCSTSLSERQAILISRYCNNAVVILDGDKAGQEAAMAVSQRLEQEKIKPYCMYLPDGHDPDNFLLTIGTKKMKRIINTMFREDVQHLRLSLD